MSNEEIRAYARCDLDKNIMGSTWLSAVAAMAVHGFITYVISQVIPLAGAVILSGPMTYGLNKLFLTRARTYRPIDIATLFKGFSEDLGGIILIGIMSTLYIFLWGLLLYIPGIMKAYSYALIYQLKSDNPGMEWRDCLRESERLMAGHRMELFMLDLSFIGWYILGGLCLGIGSLWAGAYHRAARTRFYLNLLYGRQYF